MTALLAGIFVLGAFLLLRLVVVSIIANRRIDEIHTYNMRLIWSGNLGDGHPYENALPALLIKMIDVRKWRYRQFYPEVLVP